MRHNDPKTPLLYPCSAGTSLSLSDKRRLPLV